MRRLAPIATFALVAISLLVGIHYYIARRLVLDPGVPEPWRGALLTALVALGASVVLQPFVQRRLRPPVSRIVAWPTYLWVGFVFLLVCLLGASDLLLGLAGGVALAAPGAMPDAFDPAPARAVGVVSAAMVAAAVALRSALGPPRRRRLQIELERWPRALDGFRIVQLSDLHIGPILGRRFAERVSARANALAPDLVAVTGDLVDGSVRRLADDVAPLNGLRARHGVFFVTGNHDYYSGAGSWTAKARELGMRVLRNERLAVGEGDAVFDLVGVDDHRGNPLGAEGGEDLPKALAGRDPNRPAILLAHDPTTFKRAAALGVDLQLSGHTHGGQIWPFVYLVRLVMRHVAGHYRLNGSQLYVSRGTGFWGPPMRLGAPAEITEIIVRRPGSGGDLRAGG